MFENTIPILTPNLTNAQLKLANAIKNFYIECADSSVVYPIITASIASGTVTTLQIKLVSATQSVETDLVSQITYVGLLAVINYSIDGRYYYCALRTDEDISNASLDLAPGVVYIQPVDGVDTVINLSVTSPITVSLAGDNLDLGLTYQGLSSTVREVGKNCILSINGVRPDENGNIDIISGSDAVEVAVQ